MDYMVERKWYKSDAMMYFGVYCGLAVLATAGAIGIHYLVPKLFGVEGTPLIIQEGDIRRGEEIPGRFIEERKSPDSDLAR